MKHLKIKTDDKKELASSINRIIGQLKTIKMEIENDSACDQTLTQLLAVKGGVSTVGKKMISKGILNCLSRYSKDEIETAMAAMFKMD